MVGMHTDVGLLAAALEQVMRCTSDDELVVPFLDVEPASTAAHVALGRLLGGASVTLSPGCPLLALVCGTGVDPQWRTACPATAGSLWGHYELLGQLYGPIVDDNPYAALERLRALEDADFVTAG